MNIRLTAHIKQHAGDILLECQDSFNYNLGNRSFAVSDGVSQAYLPELLSRLLTSEYVRNPEDFFVKTEAGLQVNPGLDIHAQWQDLESKVVSEATPQEKFILSLKKDAVGIAAATFIGVQLKTEGISYQAIGDSVLFFYDSKERKLKVVSSMESEDGMVFGNHPEYIDSNEQNHGKVVQGTLPYRDGILFLATDALSDWILANESDAKDKMELLIGIGDHSAFNEFIDNQRIAREGKIKDDDTTFIALEFSESEIREPNFITNYAPLFEQLIYEDLLAQHKNSAAEIDQLKQECDKADAELKRTKKELASKEAVIEKMEADKLSAQDELKKAHIEAQSQKTQILVLNNRLDKEAQENKRLGERKNDLEMEVARLHIEISQLKTALETMKNQPRQADGIVEELKEKLAKANQSVESFQQRFAQIRKMFEKGDAGWGDLFNLIGIPDAPDKPSQTFIEIRRFDLTDDGGAKI